ncbi:MAG: MFS transporter [Anaerovoracaceae bacterium]|jgi:PPP family 3-phenylpropionic acid transporter
MNKQYNDFIRLYALAFAGIGSLYPLLGQYLTSIGFSGVEIGTLTATGTAIGIFASPFWGGQYYRRNNDKRLIMLLCLLAAVVAASLLFTKSFLIFYLLYGLFAFFQLPIMPLNDAMVLETKVPYGSVRMWGAIGFALGVFFAGQIASVVGLIIVLPLCSLLFLAGGWTVWRIVKSAVGEKGNKNSYDIDSDEDLSSKLCYSILFKNKKFIKLLVCAFFIAGTTVAHNTYFGFLYISVGGSIAGIGVAFLLMCGSEAPFMAWAGKISSKLGMERIILIAMILSAARFIWYSLGPPWWLLLGTFFLQGVVNGILLVELVRYVAKVVRPKMIGVAMTLYQSLSFNFSTIICQLVGGTILDSYGGRGVYLFFGLSNLIGLILYVAFGLHKGSLQTDKSL